MSRIESVFSESVVRTYNHKMNSWSEIVTSEKMDADDSHKISLVSDNKDSDKLGCVSRTSYILDDSGFSTSTGEDRDDVMVDSSTSGQQFDCHSANNLVENSLNIMGSNSHSPPPVSGKIHVWSKLATSESRVQSCENVQSKISTANKTNQKDRQDSPSVNKINRSVSLGNISGSNISSRNPGGFRRQRTTNTGSLVISEAQAHPALPPTNRRRRIRDINNNECGHMNFSSYLKKPSFKLQDCFQDQGLLSLVACIAYTFVLMVVFCVIGVIMNYIKFFLGTQSLKIIRQNIIHTRRPRPTMSSG